MVLVHKKYELTEITVVGAPKDALIHGGSLSSSCSHERLAAGTRTESVALTDSFISPALVAIKKGKK